MYVSLQQIKSQKSEAWPTLACVPSCLPS